MTASSDSSRHSQQWFTVGAGYNLRGVFFLTTASQCTHALHARIRQYISGENALLHYIAHFYTESALTW